MFSDVKSGHKVLVLWGSSVDPDILKMTVEELKTQTGPGGKVSLENMERLSLASYPASSFDVVLSGTLFPHTVVHTIQLLGEMVRIIKPQGTLILQEPVVAEMKGITFKTREKLLTTLKLSGFVDVTEQQSVPLNDNELEILRKTLSVPEIVQLLEVHCKKPNFEVGSSANLGFAKAVSSPNPSSSIAAVWKLDDLDDDDVERIDSSTLLDESDLKKPDPATLRVCGTTGKRKACKNCSCGLAEELASGTNASESSQTKTSACGNCYLGDAFRCATCPYLGMPAFKPGEKVQLTSNQLKADV